MNKNTLIMAAALSALLAACGGQDSGSAGSTAAPAAPAPAPVAAAPEPAPAPAAPVNAAGESVYKKTCALCHAAGVAGAPMPGNKDEWAPRIAQGIDTLHKHALEGFTGEKGMMPARGGAATLKDEEVMAAVDYMVGKSQ
ncbi:MAG: cytochrome c5 family protein [Betaproteobacteria bacterium HGW-Betaproteobacteria-13]|jgi:cytochrome c5|uniref:Cytochrome c5 family protein n=1 Tax=Parazoarcus communis TaxID=41977 RepID=A0A2U8GY37_9RHOO|nr:c-type cytochrome [Parazoarcus communis]AWI78310.1 cytochrome c5 family protein [Parazoarcus communis]PKO82346.1 MAG: cytochrome c5 family protein [Betaproteobacteria bacterium HGW-Betaproteobacteria-13]